MKPQSSTTASPLTKNALHGVRWLTGLQIATVIMQVGVMATLSRLLSPDTFGLFAVAAVLLRLISYFADLGFGAAVIQTAEIRTRLFEQAFAGAILVGATITAVGVGTSALAHAITDGSEITEVLGVMSLLFLCTSLGVCHVAWITRNHRFRLLAAIESASYFFGYVVVGITAALLGLGVYSLVLALIGQALFKSATAVFCARQSMRIRLPTKEMRQLVAFGSRVSGIGFLEFWSENLDVLIIGRFAGAGPLGQYNRATSLVAVPAFYMGNIVARSLLPSFSRGTTQQATRGIQHGVCGLAHVVVPPLAIAATLATPLVDVVLGGQWQPASAVVPFICVAMIFNTLTKIPAVASEGQNLLPAKLKIQLSHLLVVITLLTLAVFVESPLWFYGAIWGFGEALRFSLYILSMKRHLNVKVRKVIGAVASAFALSVVPICVSYSLTLILENQPLILALSAGSTIVLIAVALAASPSWPIKATVRELGIVGETPGNVLGRAARRVIS